ncbi:MAG: hypothetical protein WEE20_14135, partial [Bacteroidota bacterium]
LFTLSINFYPLDWEKTQKIIQPLSNSTRSKRLFFEPAIHHKAWMRRNINSTLPVRLSIKKEKLLCDS